MNRLSPLPGAISDLFIYTCTNHELTIADRYGLLAILLTVDPDENVGFQEELRCIDRILYLIRRGRVRLSSKLSALS